MTSIVPLTYLLCLACMLTPIVVFLSLQVIKFNTQKIYISDFDDFIPGHDNQYQMANIYINHKLLFLALTLLENGLYCNEEMNQYWLAKYHNAIGFILERANLKQLSGKHYLLASELCPEYVYSAKNFENLNKS